MSRAKKIMVKGMNRLMLDCDTATLLITKSEFARLTCIEKTKLRLHLLSCKFCRRFKKQSELISLQLDRVKRDVDANNLRLHLTEEQKRRLKEKLNGEK